MNIITMPETQDLARAAGLGLSSAALAAATGSSALLYGSATGLSVIICTVAWPIFQGVNDYFLTNLKAPFGQYMTDVTIIHLPLTLAIGVLYAARVCTSSPPTIRIVQAVAMALLLPFLQTAYEKLTGDEDSLPLIVGSHGFLAGCLLGGNPILLGATYALATLAVSKLIGTTEEAAST